MLHLRSLYAYQGCKCTCASRQGHAVHRLPTNMYLRTLRSHADLFCTFKAHADALSHLNSLKRLCVSHNLLNSSQVPWQTLGQLACLTQLLLEHNALVSVGQPLCESGSLRVLKLSYNQLTGLPAEICGMTALEELTVTNNRLTELPSTLGAFVWDDWTFGGIHVQLWPVHSGVIPGVAICLGLTCIAIYQGVAVGRVR